MTDKMDDILTKGSPWEFIDPNNLEELRIPKCADQFVRLLDAIRERYCSLPQPGHQLQFLNLQLELIENFRRRLVQLHNSSVDNVKTTHILNAINYITLVLREWGENVVSWTKFICEVKFHLILNLYFSTIFTYMPLYSASMPKKFIPYSINWWMIWTIGNSAYWKIWHQNRSIILKQNQWNIVMTIGLRCSIKIRWNRLYCRWQLAKCYRWAFALFDQYFES